MKVNFIFNFTLILVFCFNIFINNENKSVHHTDPHDHPF